jgi:ferredoxin-NADP reductase
MSGPTRGFFGRRSGDVAPLVRPDVTAYLCGSAGFTAHAGGRLEAAGVPADRIRVERFGPTG